MSKPRVDRQKLERRVDAAIEAAGKTTPEALNPMSCLAHYTKYLWEHSEYSKSTICTTFNKLDIFFRWMGIVGIEDLADLNLGEMRSFFAWQRERGLKDSTLRQYRVELNEFFLYLNHIGILTNKRLLLERIRFHGQAVEIEIVSMEEMAAMIHTIKADMEAKRDAWRFDITFKPHRDHCILLLLIATGLRPGEIVGIRKSDLCLEKTFIHIHGKGNNLYTKRYRKAYIDQPDLLEALRGYLKLREHLDTEYLFCSWDGIPLRSMYISTMVRTLGFAAGLDRIINPTALRQTFCSHLAARDVDLFCIKELMGHKWIDTALSHYTHFPEPELRDQAARFNPLGGERV